MRSVIAEASSSNSNGVPVASLAQGAVWWQPPAVALRAAADAALKEPVISSAYNDDMGLPELRAALLRKCERDHGLREKEHAAMVSAGANLAVSALALALLDSDSSSAAAAASNDDDDDGARNKRTRKKKNNNRKDAAVLFPPYYFNAKMAVQLAGAEVVLGRSDPETWLPDVGWLEERLREEDEDEEDAEREEAEAEEAEAAGDSNEKSPLPPRIRMVYLVNPGNPSGVVVPYELVQRLVEACSGRGRRRGRGGRAVFLVLDSTYEAFAPPRRPLPPPPPISSGASSGSSPPPDPPPPFPLPSAPHVIHVGSFSKSYGAAGWRVGYVVYPLVRGRRGGGGGALAGGDGRGGGGDDRNAGGASSPASSSSAAAAVDLLGPQLLKIQDTLPIHAAIASQRLALACLDGREEEEEEKEKEREKRETRTTAAAEPGSSSFPPPPNPDPSSSFGRAWVEEKVAGLASSKKMAEEALRNLGPGSRVWGEGAIYLWARLPPPPPPPPKTTTTTEGGGGERNAAAAEAAAAAAADDREFVRFCVSKHGVAVIPGSACGVPGCVRVAYGKPRPGPEFEEAAARLGRACTEWVARK